MLDSETTSDLRKALSDALDKERNGMLGIEGSNQHMQPMTHFWDEQAEALFFITSQDTELSQTVGKGATAHFTITARKDEVYACMKGRIARVVDPGKLDDIWTPAAAMWFDGGKDDPDVTLLRMDLDTAAVWKVDANALQFGIEMARGVAGDHTPDVGRRDIVTFTSAA